MTKLEECARALREAAEHATDNETRLALCPYPNTPVADEDAELLARAVIRCLMEPDKAMIDKARAVDVESWDLSLQNLTDEDASAVLRAMLQSVLDAKE